MRTRRINSPISAHNGACISTTCTSPVTESIATGTRPDHNFRANDGPAKALGDGRQCVTSAGTFVLYPGSLVGPDNRGEGCLSGSPDGATRFGRKAHRTAGLRLMQPSQTTTKSRRHSPRRCESRQPRPHLRLAPPVKSPPPNDSEQLAVRKLTLRSRAGWAQDQELSKDH